MRPRKVMISQARNYLNAKGRAEVFNGTLIYPIKPEEWKWCLDQARTQGRSRDYIVDDEAYGVYAHDGIIARRRAWGILGEYVFLHLMLGLPTHHIRTGRKVDPGYDLKYRGTTFDVKFSPRAGANLLIPLYKKLNADIFLLLHSISTENTEAVIFEGFCTRDRFMEKRKFVADDKVYPVACWKLDSKHLSFPEDFQTFMSTL